MLAWEWGPVAGQAAAAAAAAGTAALSVASDGGSLWLEQGGDRP